MTRGAGVRGAAALAAARVAHRLLRAVRCAKRAARRVVFERRACSGRGAHDAVHACGGAAGIRHVRNVGVDSAACRGRRSGRCAFATTEVVAELAKGGHLDAGSITPLGRAGIGLGMRAGTPRQKIGTAAEIKQTLLAAKSVAYAHDGASRVHIERMFERLGIAAEMKAKALLEQGSVRAAEKVVAGEAEILLTLVSEILPVEGLELLGPLPDEFQSYISFAAAVGARTTSADAARAFIDCVASWTAAPTFSAQGIQR